MNYTRIFYFTLLTIVHFGAVFAASEAGDEHTKKMVTADIAKDGATKTLLRYVDSYNHMQRNKINAPQAIQLLIDAQADVNAYKIDHLDDYATLNVLMRAFCALSPTTRLYSYREVTDAYDDYTEAEKVNMLSDRFKVIEMLVGKGANVHFTDRLTTEYKPNQPSNQLPQTILSIAAHNLDTTPEEIMFLLNRNPNPEPYEVEAFRDHRLKDIKNNHRQWHTATCRPQIRKELAQYLPVYTTHKQGTQASVIDIIDGYLELPKDF